MSLLQVPDFSATRIKGKLNRSDDSVTGLEQKKKTITATRETDRNFRNGVMLNMSTGTINALLNILIFILRLLGHDRRVMAF